MATPVTDPLVGTLIDDRYEVIRRIARGGMATVYFAHDTRLERDVALKVMHPHLAEGMLGADFIARFRREARAAARLTHPGLVAVHDQGIDGEVSYLTMEYVAGSNLRIRLSSAPALSVSDVFDIVESILDAVGTVHRANLVHRDLKPENVLISSDGRVKVTDFGLARAVTQVTAATTGTIMGTVTYLSPELITTGHSDARADVYAVGIMLYEMLTGQPPFSGSTPIQIALQHLNATMPSVSSLVPGLPVEIDELVASLTARDVSDRPSDASAAWSETRRVRALLDDATLDRAVPPPVAADSLPEDPVADEQVPPANTDATRTEAFNLHATAALQQPWMVESRGREVAGSGTVDTTAVVTTPGSDAALAVQANGPIRPSTTRLRRRILIAALAVLLLAGGGAGGYTWYHHVGPGAYTTVPTGTVSVDSASSQAAITAAGLAVVVDQAYSDTVVKDEVISAEPSPGEKIRKDGAVTLTVSKGVEHFTVPTSLVGKSEANAERLVAKAGFTIGKSNLQYYDDVSKGKVTEVSVPEGSSQPHNTVIVLTVSNGPAPVTVPTLTGKSEADAKAALEAVGLTMSQGKAKYDEVVPKGAVISQSPKAATEVHRNDNVKVIISQGPPLVAVPSVVRMSEEEATRALTSAGFKVNVNRYLSGILDTVRFQSVDGGTKAPKGSTVTITVW